MNVSDNSERPKQDPESQGAEVAIDSTEESQERLRKLLADLDLTPEQTRDDMVVRSSRDQEFLDDVPPHHG